MSLPPHTYHVLPADLEPGDELPALPGGPARFQQLLGGRPGVVIAHLSAHGQGMRVVLPADQPLLIRRYPPRKPPQETP